MTTARHHLPPFWVMALGLVAVAANLRTVMASVPPLVQTIAVDLGVSNAAMGALTTLPVLCMGVFAPVAQRVSARIGAAGAVEVAAACLALGTGLRLFAGHVWPLYAGTFLAGVGIAVGGTLLPGLVKELFPPHRAGLVTGLYMLAMMGGAAASSALAVPLMQALGSWQGVAGLVGPAGRRRTGRVVPGGPRGMRGYRAASPRRRHRPPPALAARHGLARRRVPRHPVVAVLLLPRLARPHLRRPGLGPHPRGLPAVGLHLRPAGLGPARPRADRPGPRPPGASAVAGRPRSGRPARPVAGAHSGALAVGRRSSASARGRPSRSAWC